MSKARRRLRDMVDHDLTRTEIAEIAEATGIRLSALLKRSMRLKREVDEILDEIGDIAIEVDRIRSMKETPIVLKRSDGRLTDAGIRAINAAFQNGMSVGDAAKFFAISPSAASTRRKLWAASKMNASN